ncbi:hypothetical protein FLAG1_10990 [Fusarium langsethiae]|uniref:CFEM domain-containing protein n=1 Tax=Fusarium langsethiae TaxID=179993 RepID=A0A0M9ENG3_FUSLA|nr:hypothetical protein FLAG1_10990 [Fusarium langsethiae]GKU08148.1 unnamed protein product [Fusarium langsethiae]GKU09379.1 unnamed protein product [Fusarium langsethiae]
MKTSAITAIAATSLFSAPALAGEVRMGRDLEWVPECGIICVEHAVAAQGCDPSIQECYCGKGFHEPWYHCMTAACDRENLPNAYIWGLSQCDPNRSIYVGDKTYDIMVRGQNGTVIPRVPTNTTVWSASPTFLSDSHWSLETPRSIKSSVHTTTAAEEVAAIKEVTATESTTKASTTGPTATSTKHATVTDSGSGMTKAGMASVGLVSVATMFLLV